MAYNASTIKTNELLGDGQTRLTVEFTGNAGEAARIRPFVVTGATTALQLREWAFAQLADLNAGRTVSTLAALQPGQAIAAIAPPAPPGPTPEQVWQVKARRLPRAQDLALTTAAAVADLATLRADVNATYVAGYLLTL